MTTLEADRVDELLFDMYKQQVLKQLRAKMPPDMLRTLLMMKDGVGSSDFGDRVSRLESYLASMVAVQDGDAIAISEPSMLGLKSRLESRFGSVFSNEVIMAIVELIAARSSKMPSVQTQNEDLATDLLNLLVGSSLIKPNGCELATPATKRKNVTIISPIAPVKRAAKLDRHNIDSKILFPEETCPDVEIVDVVPGPSKTTKQFKKDESDVVFVKEVRLNDRLNEMCNSSDALYNKKFSTQSKVDVQGATTQSKVDVQGASTMENPRSPSLDIVSGYRIKFSDVGVPIPDSVRFPISPREKMVYTAVCSLARSKLANSPVANIGGCILKYFSLGESMVGGKQVCTFVINALCQKLFLDRHPSLSMKHYFFFGIAEVFLSESLDYTNVEKSFKGAGSVLPLPSCELLFFPVLSSNHWFLFVVDMKRSFFMFLDSLYSKDDAFSLYTREKLIVGFINAWDKFVGSRLRFSGFKAAYPVVPKQENEVDCGIFLIKFMELWGNGVRMTEFFSQHDIPSIRVKILNELVFSKHNKADISAVNDFISMGASMA